jgi:hypothetical protein
MRAERESADKARDRRTRSSNFSLARRHKRSGAFDAFG